MRVNRVSKVSSAANPVGFEAPVFCARAHRLLWVTRVGGVGVLEAEGLSMRSLQLL